MTRSPIRGGLLLAALAAGGPARADCGEGIHGNLEGRVTWTGTVRLVGDVEVTEGASLTVEAGTRVIVSPLDTFSSGWSRDRIEIRVKGEITVAGTPGNPVVFEVDGPAPPPGDESDDPPRGDGEQDGDAKEKPSYPWHGIVLLPAADPRRAREIHGAVISRAFAGIQVPKGRAGIEGCVFHSCGSGVEVGSAYADEERYGTAGGVARPAISGCRFARCGTGVFAERAGAPSVSRCAFARCRLGVGGYRATGSYYPLGEPGCAVDRCDFLRNSTGVLGPGVVTSSIFAGNDTALTLSSFHTRQATGVDEYVYRGNVFAGDGASMRGESVLGEALAVEMPGWIGDRTELLHSLLAVGMPALPEGLRLAAGAAARGRAADGGDPGSLGNAATPPNERTWSTAGTMLRRPLAVESAPEGDAPDPKEDPGFSRLRPLPGSPLRKSWWSRVLAHEDGLLRLREVFGRGEAPGALAFRFECPAGGPSEIEVNGDLLEAEAWWNGERLDGLIAPRRFDEAGLILRAPAKSGANHLLLRVRGRGADPRLGVAIHLPGTAKPEEAEIPAPRPARIASAQIVREREGEAWLRVIVAAPMAWTARGSVRLVGADGSDIPAKFARARFEETRVVRFGPLPEEALRGCGALLDGFRAPDGALLEFPPEPVPVAPLPAK